MPTSTKEILSQSDWTTVPLSKRNLLLLLLGLFAAFNIWLLAINTTAIGTPNDIAVHNGTPYFYSWKVLQCLGFAILFTPLVLSLAYPLDSYRKREGAYHFSNSIATSLVKLTLVIVGIVVIQWADANTPTAQQLGIPVNDSAPMNSFYRFADTALLVLVGLGILLWAYKLISKRNDMLLITRELISYYDPKLGLREFSVSGIQDLKLIYSKHEYQGNTTNYFEGFQFVPIKGGSTVEVRVKDDLGLDSAANQIEVAMKELFPSLASKL